MQRVSSASVVVDNSVISRIGKGLLILLGIGKNDSDEDVDWLSERIVNLRIFQDDLGKMNKSLLQVGGEMLVVSQFTLYGDCRRGRRPSFTNAATPEIGRSLYERFVERVKTRYDVRVECGIFGAHMSVKLVNDGPVTLLLDSERKF